jgi:hypothetical protein
LAKSLNKSIEELIEFCKEKGINYLTRAKKTIITNLKKSGLIKEDNQEVKIKMKKLISLYFDYSIVEY